MAKLFEVGKTYSYPALYGGTVSVTVVARTEDTVSYRESWISEDDGSRVFSEDVETTTITTLSDGNEAFIAWEYKGHYCYVEAMSLEERSM